MNSNAFRSLSYGVYIVSTLDGNRPTGCTANSAMQITSDPATIAVSINHDNYTNGCMTATGKFALSILSEQSDPSIIGTFGFQSGKDIDKFESVSYELKKEIPVISDSCAYIVCEIVDRMETATHTIFLGKVVDADIMKPGDSMTYAYYHKVVKGKAPKNAPTYLPESDGALDEPSKESKAPVYICSVCGYVYDGSTPFEELPDDYTCPICKQPKSVFEKQ